jgi:hypothetical protein
MASALTLRNKTCLPREARAANVVDGRVGDRTEPTDEADHKIDVVPRVDPLKIGKKAGGVAQSRRDRPRQYPDHAEADRHVAFGERFVHPIDQVNETLRCAHGEPCVILRDMDAYAELQPLCAVDAAAHLDSCGVALA